MNVLAYLHQHVISMCKIWKHTIPFGPNVVLTKSAIAMAPTKDAYKEMTLHGGHIREMQNIVLSRFYPQKVQIRLIHYSAI
jgi:hypothetical protein